jgi:uncharacterized protein (DUF2235 family)
MNHALVCINGVWVSFGLHIPSPQWTNVFQSLQRAYGAKNVCYLFWAPAAQIDEVADVRTRLESEIHLANMAQRQWEAGELKDVVDEDGNLHVSRGIAALRQPVV